MKHMQSIERIPLSEICIEPYQRVLNNARVKRIADNFDPARVGVLLHPIQLILHAIPVT